MVLETFVAINSTLLATRAINTKIEQDMRDKILTDGLYHVTSDENAQKIMESGHINPSNNILSMGRKKCFFFAGTPNYRDLSSNCASEATKYEFKAIKLMPSSEELSKFRQRSFNDDSITFRGKCQLSENRTKVVDLVLDIDEKGNIFTREKTEEELEKYVPNPKLVEQMEKMMNKNTLGIMSKAYVREYQTVGKKLLKKLSGLKDKLIGKRSPMLPQAVETNNHVEHNAIETKDITKELQGQVYASEEMAQNIINTEEIKKEDRSIESKEII